MDGFRTASKDLMLKDQNIKKIMEDQEIEAAGVEVEEDEILDQHCHHNK